MTTHAPTVAFSGIDCLDIDVQVQVAAGMPAFAIVGLSDKAVGESRERVLEDDAVGHLDLKDIKGQTPPSGPWR